MADWYFSNSGDDNTGDGSQGSPYATWSKAWGLSLSAGDTLNFNRGDTFYTSQLYIGTLNGTSGSHITAQPYGTGAMPKIRCAVEGGTNWIDSSVTNGPGTPFPTEELSGGGNVVYALYVGATANQPNSSEHSRLDIDGVGQFNSESSDYLAWDTATDEPGVVFNDIANQDGKWSVSDEIAGGDTTGYVYLCSSTNPNTNGSTYEVIPNNSQHGYTFRFLGSASYIDFVQLDIGGGYQTSVWASGAGGPNTISNVTFTDCIFGGAYQRGFDIWMTAAETASITFTRCLFHNLARSGSTGLYCITGAGHTIVCDRCRFTNCHHGIQAGDATSWTNGVVKRCLFYALEDDAIWMGNGNPIASGTLAIYCNIIIKTEDVGLQIEGNATDKTKNVHAWNNTVVHCAQDGLLIWGTDSTCSAKNNAIYNCNRQDGQAGTDRDYSVEVRGSTTGPDVDYNCVYSDGATTFTPTSLTDGLVATEQANWTAYQIAHALAGGNDGNSINSDPLFSDIDPTHPTDCKLRKGSPCINAGVANGSIVDDGGGDYFGNAWGSPPSIGAVEFVAREFVGVVI